MNHKERRRAPRTKSSVPLELYDPKGRMVVGEGRFVNLSEQGALILSRKPLQKSQAVRLHILAGGKPTLELAGKLIWARKKPREYAYGIKFSAKAPKEWLGGSEA